MVKIETSVMPMLDVNIFNKSVLEDESLLAHDLHPCIPTPLLTYSKYKLHLPFFKKKKSN